MRQGAPANHLFLRVSPQVPQQVIGHLGVARVAVQGFEFLPGFGAGVVDGVVAGLGQQAAQALLPEGRFGAARGHGAGGGLADEARRFGQLILKINQFGRGQKDIMLAHEANYLFQIVVIQCRRTFFRGQKRLQLVHQIAAVLAAQLRVEAGHAQLASAHQRQHGLELLRAGPDGKYAVAQRLLGRFAGLQLPLRHAQVVESAFKRQRGESHFILQKANEPDFGLKHIALAVRWLAEHHHPGRADFLHQKLQVPIIRVGGVDAAHRVHRQGRRRLGPGREQQAAVQEKADKAFGIGEHSGQKRGKAEIRAGPERLQANLAGAFRQNPTGSAATKKAPNQLGSRLFQRKQKLFTRLPASGPRHRRTSG